MKTLRVLFTVCVLLVLVGIHYKVDAQHLTLTGKGQLTIRPDGAKVVGGFMCIGFLPQYKPNTKSIAIANNNIENDAGDLIRQNVG